MSSNKSPFSNTLAVFLVGGLGIETALELEQLLLHKQLSWPKNTNNGAIGANLVPYVCFYFACLFFSPHVLKA